MSAFRRSTGSTVGRVDDIRGVRQTLMEARLVTLLGPGGVGKTTLAAEVANEVEPEFGRVRLFELAEAGDRHDLLRLMAAGLLSGADGATGRSGTAAAVGEEEVERLVSALTAGSTLSTGSALLILDNCEHLIDDVAELVGTVLAAPEITVLTTSRRPLEVAGEVLWTVRPLGLPSHTDRTVREQTLLDSAAVQLFLERTRQVVPSFTLDDRNRSTVARICAAADGVPLVIELAAALVRTRPLDQILQAMTSDPSGLEDGRRDRAEHQRSLTASLDWSRRFLSADDRRLLDRLSVFVGGFTADAAVHTDPTGTGAGLARLVDHSLVQFDPTIDRYLMLEVVRLDALARLDGTERTEAEAGHTAACLEMVAGIEADRYDADPDGLFPRYDRELPNLAAALRRTAATEDLAGFRRLIGPIAVWWIHGDAPEDPAQWEEPFAEDGPGSGGDVPDHWRGNMFNALAFYWSHRGDHEQALVYAERAAAIHRRSGHLIELALDDLTAGNALVCLGRRDEAGQAYHRGLETAIASGHPYPEIALRLVLVRFVPDSPETEVHLRQAQSLASSGFGAIEAALVTEWALHALRSGRLAEAERPGATPTRKVMTGQFTQNRHGTRG